MYGSVDVAKAADVDAGRVAYDARWRVIEATLWRGRYVFTAEQVRAAVAHYGAKRMRRRGGDDEPRS